MQAQQACGALQDRMGFFPLSPVWVDLIKEYGAELGTSARQMQPRPCRCLAPALESPLLMPLSRLPRIGQDALGALLLSQRSRR